MARIKPIFIMIFAVAALLAMLVSFLVYKKLQNRSRVAPSSTITQTIQSIAVAAVDLAPGTTIKKEMMNETIRMVSFLRKSLPAGCFSDASTLEGRVLLFPVKANEPIFESRLAPNTIKTGGIAAVVKSNKRAVAVRVTPVTGISGLIHPGNMVDVLFSTTDTSKRKGMIAKIVLENILVLAVGVELVQRQDGPMPVDVITLEVTPEEAEKLALASTLGNIHFALRNFLDKDEVYTRGATVPALLLGKEREDSGDTRTVKVQVIKGATVTELDFGMRE